MNPAAAIAASLLFLVQSKADLASTHNGSRAHPLILTNKLGKLIVEVHIADDHAENWEEDVLGADMLYPGKSVSVDIGADHNGNCLIGVNVILDNGESQIFRRVNVCYEHSEISIE